MEWDRNGMETEMEWNGTGMEWNQDRNMDMVTLTNGIPCTHDDSSIVRLVLDGMYDLSQLVHTLAAVVGVHVHVAGSIVTPLEAIYWTKITWGEK